MVWFWNSNRIHKAIDDIGVFILNVSKDEQGCSLEKRRKERTMRLYQIPAICCLVGMSVWKEALNFPCSCLTSGWTVVGWHTSLTPQSHLKYHPRIKIWGLPNSIWNFVWHKMNHWIFKLLFETEWWRHNDCANLFIESKRLCAVELKGRNRIL